MAGLTWIFFAICVVVCSAQWGPNGRGSSNRPPFPFLGRPPFMPRRPVMSGRQDAAPKDNTCYTMTRRQMYTNRMWQYLCSRRMPGVPVIRSYSGPMGEMCMSYFRMPQFQYYRVETCCPGWSRGPDGQCTTRTATLGLPRPGARNYMRMMKMASQMRSAMRQRMMQRMAQRRAMMATRMRQQLPPTPAAFRGPMPPLPMILMMRRMRNRMQRPRPPMPFFGGNRPTRPPMPHPVQRPPISRMIRIVRTMLPFSRFSRNRRLFPRPPFVPQIPPRTTPGVFFPNQMRPRQFSRMARINRIPQMGPRRPQMPQTLFPEIPARSQLDEQHYEQPSIPKPPKPFPSIPEERRAMAGPRIIHLQSQRPREMPVGQDQLQINVDLPEQPIQMPDIIVEQGPLNEAGQESCLTKLEDAVKSCLKESNIDVPDIMAAFEPLNDATSAALCRDEEVIFNCINDVLQTCPDDEEGMAAQDMFQETVDTVSSMCDMRDITVNDVLPADASSSVNADTTNMEGAQSGDNTGAAGTIDQPPKVDTIDVVPELPTEAVATETLNNALQHEVHVQELKMKELYVPLIIGAGVGFLLLLLSVSLCICCCCRRQARRRMKMEKELEKPPIEGIYTIGVAPPQYETSGIPPMYYEEAKGEKLTSQSPAVLPATTETATETGESTQM